MAYRRSANGKFVYLTDSITGEQSQVTTARFVEMVKRFGSEEVMEQAFQLRITKKYLLLGHSADSLRDMAKTHGGKLPPLSEADELKVCDIRENAEIKLSISTSGKKIGRPSKIQIQAPENKAIELPIKKTEEVAIKEPVAVIDKCPWQSDPNYFKSSGESVLDIGEVTKDTCMFPNQYLNTRCQECTVYGKCTCKIKYTAEDWKRRDDRHDVKIRRAVFVDSAGSQKK